ncbi:hypothetical protein B0H11DRAFT_207309 [Mycena galericulata]|nr:hypothetical protein B0H11DRAFT_207309 [Mycena galericulata]
MPEVDEDVFSSILSHIPDSKTIYVVLIALSKAHPLFPVALTRLFKLPVYLDSYDPRAAAASHKVLDYLLQDDANTGHYPLVGSIRHLVVSIENKQVISAGTRGPPPPRGNSRDSMLALQRRLPDLFQRSVNLELLDYHSFPGYAMQSTHFQPLQHLKRLRSFAADCALGFRQVEIPAGGGNYAALGELSAQLDAAIWDIEPFLSTIGPIIAALELRHVNSTMFTVLKGQKDLFLSCHALERLKIDITEGVWDWNGGGSPAMGASPAVKFPCLGFPSVKRFELVVCDKTLQNPQIGPLNLVHCNLLTELSIDVRYSVWWADWWDKVKLFEALSPLDFPALSRLEIKDHARNTERHYWDPKDNHLRWKHPGRAYLGLVPSFLGSIRTGHLPKLSSLWVDEKVLLLPHPSAQDLLDITSGDPENTLWTQALGAAFGQLESLRVGFGPITHLTAGLILDLCDPNRLTQFGFEWKWSDYGRDESISTDLLAHLSRFPKLSDVHILFPRPQTQLNGLPDPIVDATTLTDVASIFWCNESISRVGIGNSVVWERHPLAGASAILLVSDGSAAPDTAVSKFFHAGFMPKGPAAGQSDNTTPPRPDRREEIEQLRDLLERIL